MAISWMWRTEGILIESSRSLVGYEVEICRCLMSRMGPSKKPG